MKTGSAMMQGKERSTDVPGVDMNHVIPSMPYVVYEGCSRPGQIPLIIRFIKLVKKWAKLRP